MKQNLQKNVGQSKQNFNERIKKSFKSSFEGNKRQDTGITLIALVITIIVLLILAGVTIATLTGDNGILTKAQNSRELTEQAQEKEAISIAYTGAKAENLGGTVTAEDINSQFNKNETNAEATDEDTITVTFWDTNRKYTIDENGQVTLLAENVEVNTDIYVTLYTDGTLAFDSTDKKLEGKTVAKSYDNIKGISYTSEKIDGVRVVTTPWYDDRNSVTKIDFVSKIKPTNTSNWFCQCSNLVSIENIENLNTSRVTDMSYMFYNCTELSSLDVSSFNTSKVTDMTFMFGADGSNKMSLTEIKGLENFDTSNVTTMYFMFKNCTKLTSLNVSGFDTRNVTNMRGMFCECEKITSLDLRNFDTSNVENMWDMFCYCTSLQELHIENFDTGKVTTMRSMFNSCSSLSTIDLSNFDTSNVTDMGWMFAGNGSIQMSLIEIKGLENFDTSNVTDMGHMFQNCKDLTSLDLRSFNTSKVSDMSSMFNGCSSLKSILVSNQWKTSTTNSYMFASCGVSDVTKVKE